MDFPLNALTVSGIPRTFRRNAVRHLESMFSLIRFQSSSLIWNLCTRWPEKMQRLQINEPMFCSVLWASLVIMWTILKEGFNVMCCVLGLKSDFNHSPKNCQQSHISSTEVARIANLMLTTDASELKRTPTTYRVHIFQRNRWMLSRYLGSVSHELRMSVWGGLTSDAVDEKRIKLLLSMLPHAAQVRHRLRITVE